jgi:hypothetical protein
MRGAGLADGFRLQVAAACFDAAIGPRRRLRSVAASAGQLMRVNVATPNLWLIGGLCHPASARSPWISA